MGWYRVYPDKQLFGSSEYKFVASLTHSFIPGTPLFKVSLRNLPTSIHVVGYDEPSLDFRQK